MWRRSGPRRRFRVLLYDVLVRITVSKRPVRLRTRRRVASTGVADSPTDGCRGAFYAVLSIVFKVYVIRCVERASRTRGGAADPDARRDRRGAARRRASERASRVDARVRDFRRRANGAADAGSRTRRHAVSNLRRGTAPPVGRGAERRVASERRARAIETTERDGRGRRRLGRRWAGPRDAGRRGEGEARGAVTDEDGRRASARAERVRMGCIFFND